MKSKRVPGKSFGERYGSIFRLAFAFIAAAPLLPQGARGQDAIAVQPEEDYSVVRIALATGERHIVLGVRGKFRIHDSLGQQIGTLRSGKLYFVDVMSDGNLGVRDSRGESVVERKTEIRFIPYSTEKSTLRFQRIRDLNNWRSSHLDEAPSYRGALRVLLNPEGLITVVNHVQLEDYVAGVVGTEMGNFAPAEALRAQAVATRSEALAKMIRAKKTFGRTYDFGDTSADQAYSGREQVNEAVSEAVGGTAGVVMTWEGTPIDAVYSHSCGGIIVDKTELWGGHPEPYLRRQRDILDSPAPPDLSNRDDARKIITREVQSLCNPYHEGFPEYAKDNFRWRVTLNARQLTDILDPVYRTGQIRDVDVLRRSPSGRVTKLRVTGMNKTIDFLKELKIRWVLGDLKSTFFTYRIARSATGRLEEIEILGAGYGHGVGMCQMGAFMLAKRGTKARDILRHYYPGVRFKQLKRPKSAAM